MILTGLAYVMHIGSRQNRESGAKADVRQLGFAQD